MLREFRAFVVRGNLVDLAVAVVIGTHSPRSSTSWSRT
jgi:large-conductance mechanosensitive channel